MTITLEFRVLRAPEMSRLGRIEQRRLVPDVHPDDPVDIEGLQVRHFADAALRLDALSGGRREQLQLEGGGRDAAPTVAGAPPRTQPGRLLSHALHRHECAERDADTPRKHLQEDEEWV